MLNEFQHQKISEIADYSTFFIMIAPSSRARKEKKMRIMKEFEGRRRRCVKEFEGRRGQWHVRGEEKGEYGGI